MIVRTPRRRHFTLLPNRVLEDDRLSLKAKGLLGYVLSKPDHWRCNSDQLATIGPDGRDAIRTALGELRKAGYAELKRSRGEGGRMTSEWHITDTPPPTTDSPAPEEPAVGAAGAGKPGPVVRTEEARTEEQVSSTSSRAPAKIDVPVTRKRDPLWDAVMEACGVDSSSIPANARGAYNRALAELREAGATPEEVLERGQNYVLRWGPDRLTPTALVRRWAEVARPPAGEPSKSMGALQRAAARGRG